MNSTRTYYKDGQLCSEEWREEAGEPHRLDGPAYREWYKNGRLWVELWYVNGLRHRLDGPAYQYWDRNGQREELWWINGVKYETEAEFQVAVDLYKANEIAELF